MAKHGAAVGVSPAGEPPQAWGMETFSKPLSAHMRARLAISKCHNPSSCRHGCFRCQIPAKLHVLF